MLKKPALVALALACCAGQAAVHAATFPPQKNPVKHAIIESAAALGMVRGAHFESRSINRIQYIASGTVSIPAAGSKWTAYQVSKATVAMNYRFPALRLDMQRTGADGASERVVHVVRGNLAWNETTPGVGATPAADDAVEWLGWRVWATPHGVIRAALDAEEAKAGAVKLSKRQGGAVLSFSRNGMPVTVTLGADHLPVSIAMDVELPVLGRTAVESRFADYRNWEKLDVLFPAHITRTMSGHRVLDLTVSGFRSNPYVVFPIPAVVRK